MNIDSSTIPDCACGCGEKVNIAKRGPQAKIKRGHQSRVPLLEGFLSRVDKNGDGGCWNWTGFVTPLGYGFFWNWTLQKVGEKRVVIIASRMSWMIHRGEIPVGMFVCHSCDNRRCVNPDHLWLGTNQQNMQDMKRKGRSARGSKSGTAKLTEENVLVIKREFASGVRVGILAKRYGVSTGSIHSINCGRTWGHVILDSSSSGLGG